MHRIAPLSITMASTRAFLALALVALALVASVEAARELRGAQDTVITNCRTYGTCPERLGACTGLQLCQNNQGGSGEMTPCYSSPLGFFLSLPMFLHISSLMQP